MQSELNKKIIKNIQTDENFVKTTYNEISVIIHEKTGYYNVTKIGNDTNKQVRKYINSEKFQNKIKIYLECFGCGKNQPDQNLVIYLDKNYNNELKGIYIYIHILYILFANGVMIFMLSKFQN